MLSVFGLSMVGVLAGKSLVKGVAACAGAGDRVNRRRTCNGRIPHGLSVWTIFTTVSR
jgi:hypothetical protein